MTELREARIVMPEVNAIGAKPHDALRAALCGAFGGFTMTYGVGGWVDGDYNVIRDSVCIYDVAMEQARKNDSKLRDIAIEAGKALGQQSVYLRYSSGSTAIISLTPATPAAEPHGERDKETDDLGFPPAELPIDAYDAMDSLGYIGDLSSMRGKSPGEKALEDVAALAEYVMPAKHPIHDALKGVAADTPISFNLTKRLPQVGEIWLARDGATRIAVLKQATLLDGGFDCVTLTKGATALREGYPIVVDLDGRYIRGVPQESHPLDLVQFHSCFLA